jgi:hypothetical protein
MTFEFNTPYIVGCTPPNPSPWGIYDAGGKNGLLLRGKATCPVSLSVDRGRTWIDGGRFSDGLDLTDHVKGYRQYRLRLGSGAKALAGSGLKVTTVCQASVSVIPRLKDGGTRVSFESSGRAVVSAGPTREQAKTHLVEGAFGSPLAVLELAAPKGGLPVAVHRQGLANRAPGPGAQERLVAEFRLGPARGDRRPASGPVLQRRPRGNPAGS